MGQVSQDLLQRTGPVSLPPPPSLQYMMLSGQVPFQGASGQGGQSQAAEIMCKIREGRFSLDGEAWQGVSEEAKELVRGAQLDAAGHTARDGGVEAGRGHRLVWGREGGLQIGPTLGCSFPHEAPPRPQDF